MLLIGIIILLLSSCTNQAYNKVSTDTMRSQRNAKLLLNTCQVAFPVAPPKVTEGKITIKIDTATVIIKDTFYSVKKDTVYISKVVTKTIEKIIHRTDTIDRGDSYAVQNILKENNRIKADYDLLNNRLTISKEDSNKWRKRFFIAFALAALELLLYILKVHLTKRFL